MVRGGVTLRFLVELEHREIDHPQCSPAALEQTILLAKLALPNLDAQGAHGVVDNFGFVGAKENQVTVLRTAALEQLGNRLVVKVLDEGRLQTRPAQGLVAASFGQIVDLDVGQTLGAVNLDKLAVGINLTASQTTDFACATRNAQTDNPAALHAGG